MGETKKMTEVRCVHDVEGQYWFVTYDGEKVTGNYSKTKNAWREAANLAITYCGHYGKPILLQGPYGAYVIMEGVYPAKEFTHND